MKSNVFAGLSKIGQNIGYDTLFYFLIGAAIITAIVSLLIAAIFTNNSNDFFDAFKGSAAVIGTIFFFILVLSGC